MIETKQKGRNYAENLYVKLFKSLFLVNIATFFWLFEVIVVVYHYSFKLLLTLQLRLHMRSSTVPDSLRLIETMGKINQCFHSFSIATNPL